ncbi:MAG: single-stranded-DNA-specific exonuclease RecJ, partial [Flavobacteriales bacterium]
MSAFNIPIWLAQLLTQRGLFSESQVKAFFSPSSLEVHDPFLMSDMKEAVKLLFHTIDRKQKVMVYGDYDVDGTTAVSMMSDFLHELGVDHINYIPDRFTEGYGVSDQGIETAIDQNCKLIITLDCGIRAAKPIAKAKENGIKVIVCDHHQPGEILPDAYAILNPKKVNCTYPFKELSGAGVGFKLIQAFSQEQGWEWEDITHHLDLLALSIAADMVNIQGENRFLASQGLEIINSSERRIGLDLLLKKAKRDEIQLTITDLVFALSPRINAAGRLGSASDAILLLSKTSSQIEKENTVEKIEQLNSQRKLLDQRIKEEALEQIRATNNHNLSHCTVVCSQDWHKGVVGIVASRLIEEHYRPTVVLAESEGMVTGSVRSINGIDVHKALQHCESVLKKYGGHVMAAGLLLEKEKLPEFRKLFNEAIVLQQEKHLTPTIKIHAEVGLDQWTDKMFKIIERMEPFGPGNQRPLFIAKGVILE